MSGQIITIAKDEWRYWFRTKLAITVLVFTVILTLASVVITALTVDADNQNRHILQSESEHAFEDQPDRHPHRMVHFGHYLFRTPTPLGRIDPGIDTYTGTAIFLEGHRQNGATFSGQQQSTGLNWLGKLSPATVLQILAPLLLIVMGYSVITREKEAGTFTFLKVQGVSPLTLIAGKTLALFMAAGVVLLPLILGALYATFQGAGLVAALSFLAGYALYLMVWVALVMLVSVLATTNRGSFGILIFSWIAICLVLPRVSVSAATMAVSSHGKLETDFAVLEEMRTLGDGHDDSDPAFKKFKDDLLAKYNVESIDDLPVNFKGVVAQKSEADLTAVINRFASQSMDEEQAQANVARQFGWISPTIAIQTLSMKLAATDLENYHRFLKEAEAVRYDFVQSLNKLHAEALSYADDTNKYQSEANRQKAKVDSANWKMLEAYTFEPESVSQRLAAGSSAFVQLGVLMVVLFGAVIFAGRRA